MGDSKIKGFGLGLRHEHFDEVIQTKPKAIDWFEILTENYMSPGGHAISCLEQIREHYPIVFHGVSLSIGSHDPLNQDYLTALKQTIDRFQPEWVSDHLCWTGVHGKNLHDLMPMPYTKASLAHVASRVSAVQDFLGQPILLENPSSYLSFSDDCISEWEFLVKVSEITGCYLLLDVNNVYVSSFNHGYSAQDFIDALPKDKVKQIHLAGHLNKGDVIVDTHDHPIIDEVFDLYAYAIGKLGFVPTMIERDDNIPPLAELLEELELVKKTAKQALQAEVA